MRRLFAPVIPVLVVMTAACNGGSPTDPSGSGSGATISGQFVSPGQGGTRSVQSVAATPSVQGLTVSVAGTDVSAPVNGNAFSLSGVPTGPLSLRFRGNGMDSELGLAPVDGTENIDLNVSLNGSAVALESERRSFGREVQLEGLVESLTAPGSFMVGGQLVTTTADTRFFFHGDPAEFADLAVGFRVHVKGQTITGSLAAVTVMIQSTNTKTDDEQDDTEQDESASIEGTLATIGGSGATLDLLVGSTIVHTDASTRVKRRGDTQDLEVLEIGMRLHVVGTRQPDSSILARMIQIKGDATGGLFEIEGSMGGKQGTCPVIAFGVNGYSIVTDAATAFTPACSTFKNGDKVTVKGVVEAGGVVRATSVAK